MLQENTTLEKKICCKAFKAVFLSDFLIVFLTLFTSWAVTNKDEDIEEVFSSLRNKFQFIKNEKFHPGATLLFKLFI